MSHECIKIRVLSIISADAFRSHCIMQRGSKRRVKLTTSETKSQQIEPKMHAECKGRVKAKRRIVSRCHRSGKDWRGIKQRGRIDEQREHARHSGSRGRWRWSQSVDSVSRNVRDDLSLVSVDGEYLRPESVCRKPDAFIGYAMEHLKALYPLELSSWP